jgi:hypothetical protein
MAWIAGRLLAAGEPGLTSSRGDRQESMQSAAHKLRWLSFVSMAACVGKVMMSGPVGGHMSASSLFCTQPHRVRR